MLASKQTDPTAVQPAKQFKASTLMLAGSQCLWFSLVLLVSPARTAPQDWVSLSVSLLSAAFMFVAVALIGNGIARAVAETLKK